MLAFAQQVSKFVEDTITDPWTAEFAFGDGATRPQVVVAPPEQQEQLCTVYGGTDDIKGKITVTVKEGRVMDHDGISIELIGRTEILESPEVTDYKNITNFVRLSRDVTPAGRFGAGSHELEFAFENVSKEHESYYGRFAIIRYMIRITASRGFKGDFVADHDFVVQLIDQELPPFEKNPPIQLDVGVENCIHISFCYAHSHYPLDSILTGCIVFQAVRLNIVSMETSILRIETIIPRDPQDARLVHSQAIAKMECMDGTPARGDSIPVRWPLNGLGLGPSRCHPRVSVKYQIRLSLVDEKGRQFFKTCDIALYRLRLAGDNPSWFHAEDTLRWRDYDARTTWQPVNLSALASRRR
mmetsp:Transcript_9940/g.15738  ORF Transcript_9940/g.15738 Transcript_9940/m.15738 type:complete len:356 (+) Transcript_9940:66-1133(+)